MAKKPTGPLFGPHKNLTVADVQSGRTLWGNDPAVTAHNLGMDPTRVRKIWRMQDVAHVHTVQIPPPKRRTADDAQPTAPAMEAPDADDDEDDNDPTSKLTTGDVRRAGEELGFDKPDVVAKKLGISEADVRAMWGKRCTAPMPATPPAAVTPCIEPPQAVAALKKTPPKEAKQGPKNRGGRPRVYIAKDLLQKSLKECGPNLKGLRMYLHSSDLVIKRSLAHHKIEATFSVGPPLLQNQHRQRQRTAILGKLNETEVRRRNRARDTFPVKPHPLDKEAATALYETCKGNRAAMRRALKGINPGRITRMLEAYDLPIVVFCQATRQPSRRQPGWNAEAPAPARPAATGTAPAPATKRRAPVTA